MQQSQNKKLFSDIAIGAFHCETGGTPWYSVYGGSFM